MQRLQSIYQNGGITCDNALVAPSRRVPFATTRRDDTSHTRQKDRWASCSSRIGPVSTPNLRPFPQAPLMKEWMVLSELGSRKNVDCCPMRKPTRRSSVEPNDTETFRSIQQSLHFHVQDEEQNITQEENTEYILRNALDTCRSHDHILVAPQRRASVTNHQLSKPITATSAWN